MRARTLLTVLFLCPVAGLAQERRTLTEADYSRAEQFLGFNVNPLVLNSGVRPAWLPSGEFWYRVVSARGVEFMLVDPVRRTRRRAFDQGRLAAALSAAAGTPFDSLRLPFTQLEFSTDKRSVTFEVAGRRWTCGVLSNTCTGVPTTPGGRNTVLSPDGKRAAFIRDYNLWVREVESGREIQLTTDGVKDFGYATDNAGWTRSDRPVLLWSPDSRKIATFQQDERTVGEMYVVETRVNHPVLQAWKYPLPGDSVIQMIHRVVIDLSEATPRVIRLQLPPDAHRSTTCDHILCDGQFADVEWSPDASRLVFVSTPRDHKRADVRIADAGTGAVRDLFSEADETFFEAGFDSRNWRVLWDLGEILWYSQRDDWGHLYRYDLETGQLKGRVTSGNGNVLAVVRVDERTRTILFTGVGREPGRDPYFRHLYRVGLDGRNLRLLTPEDADHEISIAPSGSTFTDSYSRPDLPATAVLREIAEGRVLLELEQADISRLVATGWTPPLPFTVKARDNRTDLYGLLFRPTGFDSTRQYPVVTYIYPGPQAGSVGSRSFVAARSDHRALAELGFVVMALDGMGTPLRSKSFHTAWYADMGDNTLPDQVGALRQLADRYRWIDLDRAGIWGHSGGGYAAAGAILRYPDFFKVAVSQAGNHDNRQYEDDWGEKWHGLLVRNSDGTDNYDRQANQNLAKNLKGKLLIAHGTLDTNVPPYSSLLVVNELIRANKDFDLLLLPNRGHGFANDPYMIRRRWDYFVRHLLGAESPAGYEIRPPRPVAGAP